MPPPDVSAAYVRFLVLRSMPMLVVDLEAEETHEPVLLEGGLFQHLVEHGLAMLPTFYGHALPKGARLGLTLTQEELRLEDTDETRLLRVPRDSVDPDWLDNALRMKGTMLYVGRNLEMDPDLEPRELCDLLEDAAAEERVAGAIIGVAEQSQGLPLIG